MNDIKYLFLGIAIGFFIVIIKAIIQTLVERWSKKEWVGLTDDEVSKIIDKVIGFNSCAGWEEEFARAIEAKLKEKNT